MPLASPYNDETTDSSSGQIHPSPWILDSFERILLLPETHPSTFAISFQIKRTDPLQSIIYPILHSRTKTTLFPSLLHFFHPSYALSPFFHPFLTLSFVLPFVIIASRTVSFSPERERERERESLYGENFSWKSDIITFEDK